jgi:hypothetical protein
VRFPIVALGVLSCAACASSPLMQAKWLERDYNNKIGVLEYLDQGVSSIIEMRRNDALTKMEEFCKPTSYRLIKEFAGSKEISRGGSGSSMTMLAGSNGGAGSKIVVINIDQQQTEIPVRINFNYMVFKCR